MEWWVALIAGIASFGVFVATFRVYSYYEWSNDKKFARALPGKIFSIFCLQLALSTPIFYVLDRYQPQIAIPSLYRSLDDLDTSSSHTTILTYSTQTNAPKIEIDPWSGGVLPFCITFLVTFSLASFFFPFSIGFYKADDDIRVQKGTPLHRGLKRGFFSLILNAILFAAVYFLFLNGISVVLGLVLVYFGLSQLFFWELVPIGAIMLVFRLLRKYTNRKNHKISQLQKKEQLNAVGLKAQSLRHCGHDIQELLKRIQNGEQKPSKRVVSELNESVQIFILEARQIERQFDRLNQTRGPIYYFNLLILIGACFIIYLFVVIDCGILVAGQDPMFGKIMRAAYTGGGAAIIEIAIAYVFFGFLLFAEVYALLRLFRIQWMAKLLDVVFTVKRLKKGETLAESLISIAMLVFLLATGAVFALFRFSREFSEDSATAVLLFEYTNKKSPFLNTASRTITWLTGSNLFPILFLVTLGCALVLRIISSAFLKKKKKKDNGIQTKRVDALSAKIAGLNTKIMSVVSPDPISLTTAAAANLL